MIFDVLFHCPNLSILDITGCQSVSILFATEDNQGLLSIHLASIIIILAMSFFIVTPECLHRCLTFHIGRTSLSKSTLAPILWHCGFTKILINDLYVSDVDLKKSSWGCGHCPTYNQESQFFSLPYVPLYDPKLDSPNVYD